MTCWLVLVAHIFGLQTVRNRKVPQIYRDIRQPRFRNTKDTNTFSLCVCVQGVSPSRQCNYAPPSHPTLVFSFHVQRASGTSERKLTIFVSFVWVLCTSSWPSACRFQYVSTPPPPLSHCFVLCACLSHAFDETNSFGVTLLVPSLLCGLLHDVFQLVSAHPIPIEICYGMLSNAVLLTHFVCEKKKTGRRASSIIDRE